MATTDERTTKPDQLVNTQNKHHGFVVQIPEGLNGNPQNNIQFHPLIVPNSLEKRFGKLGKTLKETIRNIKSSKKLESLLLSALDAKSLDELGL